MLELLAEMMKLEANAARVYLLFSKLYPDHFEFWNTLHEEEKKHEAVFEQFVSGKLPLCLVPAEFISIDLQKVKKANAYIEISLQNFLSNHKKRSDAYGFAEEIEDLAGEREFQNAMDIDSDSESLYLIQRIVNDCKDHKERIRNLRQSLLERHRNVEQ
mgnify:CR=1 FL=1